MKVARVLLERKGNDSLESLVLRSADSIVVARKQRLPKGISPMCTLDNDMPPEAAVVVPASDGAASIVETKIVPVPKGVRSAN